MDKVVAGGTLRLWVEVPFDAALDPQRETSPTGRELLRCCLLRTLMAWDASAEDVAGQRLVPDLAEQWPVAEDGATRWTFRLRPGIRYAPPLDTLTVTAQDVVRALERLACCGSPEVAGLFSSVRGFEAYASGGADRITGLLARDDLELVVSLRAPTHDLPMRFALAASAPIPPNPDRPADRLGIAHGAGSRFGRYLAPTGPYMFALAELVDFSEPPLERTRPRGAGFGRLISLYRNPEWDPVTDPLRAAYVDRMRLAIPRSDSGDFTESRDPSDYDHRLGHSSMPLHGLAPPADLPQIQIHPTGDLRYIAVNPRVPPFDDPHVRRALQLLVDKDSLRELGGGAARASLAGHIVPDFLLDGALDGYDPYATTQAQGDLDAARAEMAASRYDRDGDGSCDVRACAAVRTVSRRDDPYPAITELLRQALRQVGIELDVESPDPADSVRRCDDRTEPPALCTALTARPDFPDPGAVFTQLVVPGFEPGTGGCQALAWDAPLRCWADLDQQLMEEDITVIPWAHQNQVDIFSRRLTHYRFDAWAGVMAIDQIAIQPGSPDD